MCRDLKHKDILQVYLAIQNMKLPFFLSSPQKYQPPELNLPGNLQEVPTDIQEIQPFPSQVWNFDYIVFGLKRSLYKMVCTYDWFQTTLYTRVLIYISGSGRNIQQRLPMTPPDKTRWIKLVDIIKFML